MCRRRVFFVGGGEGREGRECGRRQMRMLNFGEERETNLLIFFTEEDS